MPTISCHQPNFFPFAGFFQKMKECDRMILLNHSQFQKGKYNNRFNVGERWFTMPVNKGLDPLIQKKYINPEVSWNAIKLGLPKYKVLDLFDDCIKESLTETNGEIIRKLAYFLDIRTHILDDYPTDLKSTERLVDICVKNEATEYLSGVSGAKYLDLSLFDKAGIKVTFMDEAKLDKRPIIQILQP